MTDADIPFILDLTHDTFNCIAGGKDKEQLKDTTTSSLGLSLILNSLIVASAVLAFEILLRWPRFRQVLAPKGSADDNNACFHWFQRARTAVCWGPGQDLDAAVLVHFCDLGYKFSSRGAIIGFILMALYYTGGDRAKDTVNQFGLANLKEEWRLWFAIISAYALFFYLAHLLQEEWRKFIHMRREHFRHVASGAGVGGDESAQAARSIVVEGLQAEGVSLEGLLDFFERLFGSGSIHSLQLQPDTWTFYRQQELREHTRRCCGLCGGHTAHMEQALEDVDGMLRRDVSRRLIATESTSRGSQHVGQTLGQHLAGVARIVQDLTVGSHAPNCIAFITFHSFRAATEAQQVLLSHAKHWRVQSAPEPRDIIWRNLAIPSQQVQARNMAMRCLCVLGLLVWSSFIIPIQALNTAEKLEEWVHGVKGFLKFIGPLSPLVTGYVPVLALIGLQAILPYVFEWVAYSYEGQRTRVAVQRIVLNRCFCYQLASLYVSVFAGSIWDSVVQISNNPQDGLLCVGIALPKGAVYFVSFVLTRAGMSLPLLVVRPSSLWSSATGEPVRCYYGSEAADLALVFVIALSYSIVAPIILPVCALYFLLAGGTYRWLFSSVYEAEFNGNGAFWYDLFNGVFFGGFLGALSFVAMIKLSVATQSSYAVYAAAPLPLLVLAFGLYSARMCEPSSLVSMEDAADADRDNLHAALREDVYLDPASIAVAASVEGS